MRLLAAAALLLSAASGRAQEAQAAPARDCSGCARTALLPRLRRAHPLTPLRPPPPLQAGVPLRRRLRSRRWRREASGACWLARHELRPHFRHLLPPAGRARAARAARRRLALLRHPTVVGGCADHRGRRRGAGTGRPGLGASPARAPPSAAPHAPRATGVLRLPAQERRLSGPFQPGARARGARGPVALPSPHPIRRGCPRS